MECYEVHRTVAPFGCVNLSKELKNRPLQFSENHLNTPAYLILKFEKYIYFLADIKPKLQTLRNFDIGKHGGDRAIQKVCRW